MAVESWVWADGPVETQKALPDLCSAPVWYRGAHIKHCLARCVCILSFTVQYQRSANVWSRFAKLFTSTMYCQGRGTVVRFKSFSYLPASLLCSLSSAAQEFMQLFLNQPSRGLPSVDPTKPFCQNHLPCTCPTIWDCLHKSWCVSLIELHDIKLW